MQETDAQRREAFERLADEHILASYRLANAILGDTSESRDAVHDAVLNAWQKWDTLRDRTKFEAWFDRIVVNNCRERLRRAKRRRAEDIADQTSISTPDAAAAVHRRIEVELAFARLKADDALILALRHFMDLEMDDIALLLDVLPSTARTRLASARRRLRQVIEQQSADGPR
jgi:RNA polymerase sigma-70 factor (ECF subfamily)